jgi:hypothetical protein
MGAFESFSVWVMSAPQDASIALTGLRAIRERLAQVAKVIHPMAEDAFWPLSRSIASRLLLLRQTAPFGALHWVDVRVLDGGKRAEVQLVTSSGDEAWVWLGERDGRPVGGYRVADGVVSDVVKDGLRAVLVALGPPESASKRAAVSRDARDS